MNKLTTVDFHGDKLPVLKKDGKILAVMKPIAEALGLDWSAQLQRIKRDPALKQGVFKITTPTTDGGLQEMITLPIEFLNGWLFRISINHVKPEIKEKLTEYQKECYKALHDYHFKGIAINDRRIAELETVNHGLTEQVALLKDNIDHTVKNFDQLYYKAFDGKKELADKVDQLTKEVELWQGRYGEAEYKLVKQNEIPDCILKDSLRQKTLDLARISKVDIQILYGRIYNHLKEKHGFDVMEIKWQFKSGLDAIEYGNHLRTVEKLLNNRGSCEF